MRYNPALICEPDPSHRWDLHGFEDSRNLFIHGVVSGHGGTCTSMPLMYLAVGRRLGYPLRLVLAKAHLFVRWEETGGERFNIEATTTRGLNTFSDDYYRKWPLEITEDEMRRRILSGVAFASRGVWPVSLSSRPVLVCQRQSNGCGEVLCRGWHTSSLQH